MSATKLYKQILPIMSEETDICEESIESECRCSDVVDSRNMIMYILNKIYDIPVKNISKIFNFSNTNTYNHINNFENRMNNRKILQLYYNKIVKRLSEINVLISMLIAIIVNYEPKCVTDCQDL